MPDHIVSSFDQDLEKLRRTIAEMGGIAEKMLADAITALVRRDSALAQAVIASDQRLDVLQRDLERIGDLAKNIGKRALAVGGQFEHQKVVLGVQTMSERVSGQLKDVLDAYTTHDTHTAIGVWERDGATDALYTSLFRELLTYMMEDPRNITFCTHLLFCAKNVERIGDHTTNIAETIHYLVTGQTIAADRPKDDRSTAPLDAAS